jgi:hypothetical protein
MYKFEVLTAVKIPVVVFLEDELIMLARSVGAML